MQKLSSFTCMKAALAEWARQLMCMQGQRKQLKNGPAPNTKAVQQPSISHARFLNVDYLTAESGPAKTEPAGPVLPPLTCIP